MKKRGLGLATTIYSMTVTNAVNPTGCFIQVKDDGSVLLQTGANDIGQGACTVLAQVTADIFGIPLEWVTLVAADTDTTPWDIGAISSRLTLIGPIAINNAANEIKEHLNKTVAEKLKVSPDRLAYGGGHIYYTHDPEKKVPFQEAVTETVAVHKKMLIGKGYYFPHNIPVDDETGQGEPSETYYYHSTVAEVEVDTETGIAEVLNLWTGVDCGRALNPMLLEGQNDGGAMQSLGWALYENIHPYDNMPELFDPDFRPDDFTDYAIPSTMDTPEIHSTWVECYDPVNPFGAKGAGEIMHTTGAPAIANAIYDAVGVRLQELPLSPDKILKALKEKEQGGDR